MSNGSLNYIDYNRNYDSKEGSMFLDGKIGLFDTINKKHLDIWDKYKLLKSLDWDETEVIINTCNAEFKRVDKEISDMMIKTLSWQWEADSSATMISSIISPFISSSELLAYITELSKNECLTGDHEVLTSEGWKRIDQVTTDDKVAQWEYSSKKISFVNPSDIIKKHHSGVMYHVNNKLNNINQIVTPSHRLPILYNKKTDNNPEWLEVKDIEFSSNIGIPISGKLDKHGKDMSIQEKLYVIIESDGDIYIDEKCYKFILNNEYKINMIKNLCDKVNWRIEENYENNKREFYVFPKLDEFRSDVKTFDWILLDEITFDWCNEFIKLIADWNGYNQKLYAIGYVSTIKSNVDKVIAIAHLVSKTTLLSYIPKNMSIATPLGNKTHEIDCYLLYIDELDYVNGSLINKTEIEYDGEVYCLTVPSGYFLIKFNDSVSVTGNCLHSITYSEIVRLSFDDPDIVIKDMLSIKESLLRLDSVSSVFNEVNELGCKYQLGEIDQDDPKLREAVILFFITLLCLERIQFIASFCITFGIAEQGFFVPIAKLVQKIFNDEYQVHVQTDKLILSNELNTSKGMNSYINVLSRIENIIKEIVDSEIKWIDFLYGNNDIKANISKLDLQKSVYYAATDVYTFLNLDNPYENIYENPLSYMDKWSNINALQAAPQEESTVNYLLGRFIDDRENFSAKLNFTKE